MRRLSPIDADMLASETPAWHLQVAGLIVVEPPAGGFGFDELRRHVAGIAAVVEPLRERVVEVPLGLDQPMWVATDDFDVDRHLDRTTVPAPGEREQVAEIVGSLLSRKLPRDRPLWQMWWLDGLAGGQAALLATVHHAVADGVASALLLSSLMRTEPGPVATAPRDAPPGELAPGPAELLVRSIPALATLPARMTRAVVDTVRSLSDLAGRARSGRTDAAAGPFDAPRSMMNGELTSSRAVAFVSLSRAAVDAARRSHGATVNDVVLACCGGALRSYLVSRRALPDRPLVAAVPVSTRGETDADHYGNLVSGWFADLGTDLADPVERLERVRAAAAAAKAAHGSGIEDRVMQWAELPPPAVWALAMRLYTASHLARRMPPLFNLLVSNVPGAPVPLYLGPARVVATYPYGPLLDTVGCNVTVLGSAESLDVGVIVCPDLDLDPWAIAEGVPDELERLAAVS